MDVFLSYSSQDKEWVRGELLTRIEQAGLQAFIDFRDFTPAALIIKEMERGVLECRKTLVVLTPEYIASEWCDLELVMAQTLSPANRDLRLLPLLKTPCEKPLYTRALAHIDFTDGADLDLAWRRLLTALVKPSEPKPETSQEPRPEPPPEPESQPPKPVTRRPRLVLVLVAAALVLAAAGGGCWLRHSSPAGMGQQTSLDRKRAEALGARKAER